MKFLLLFSSFLFFSNLCHASGNQYEMGYYATTGSTVSGNSAIVTDANNNLLITNKVGIGTTSPDKILTVRHSNNNGITTDRATTNIYSGHTWLNNGVGNERWFIGMIPNEDTFVFRNRSINNGNIIAIEDQSQLNSLYVKANGNIGIGTSNPGYTLHVVGNIFASGNITCGGSCAGGSSQWTTSGSDIYYNTGNVGIGTASPGSKLDVKGALRLSGSTSGYVGLAPAAAAGSTTYTLPSADGSNGQVLTTNGSGALSWTTASGSSQWTTTGSDIYYNSGEVGIGTTSPNFPLEVRGEADILSLVSTGNIGAGMVLDATVNSGHKYHLYSITAAGGALAGYFLITDETASWANRVAISPAGNVGIGSDSPSYKLHVNGSVAGVGAYVNLSDGRSKMDIKPLSAGLKEITQLKPVTFKWKKSQDAGMEGQQMGFIAQDVEKILPSLVITGNDKEKIKSLKYSELIPVLAKAVQELKTDNDRLRADFEAYKKAHP